jgi:hypothetical protein
MASVLTAPPKTADVFPRTAKVHYPESDGKPMGETDKRRRIMTALIEALIAFFRNIAEVYVPGNWCCTMKKVNRRRAFRRMYLWCAASANKNAACTKCGKKALRQMS